MTNLKQDLHLAYVLHSRPFRETSLLLEVLSAEHGRAAIVARGAKRGKSKDSSILQPFVPLNLGWFGNGDLVTLTTVETAKPAIPLYGRNAICGIYINELLVKLVPKWDYCQDLFVAYEAALANLLSGAVANQVVLRTFELQLLKSLGYGLELLIEVISGAPVIADQYYLYDPVLGPKLIGGTQHIHAFKGSSLLAFANGVFTDPAVMLDLKRLMRLVLGYHLGSKQIVSRELL